MAELRWIAAVRGYASGWAAHKFRERFGIWPNDSQVRLASPREPSLKTKNWLRSRQIAYAKGRQPMARSKRRNAIGENWISYSRSMLESPAMRVLSPTAIRVMHRLEIEHMHHGGAENGRLIVTHEQFIEWGISQNMVAPAIRELVALGFVEVTEKGCGGNQDEKRANRFRLTYVNTKSREQPTHEWRKIDTIKDAAMLVRGARGEKDPRARALGRLGLHALKNKIPVTEIVSGAGHKNCDQRVDFPLTESVTT